jgi:MoaA/NifB/PqqE/SkfB family radical SAM enzyme
MCPSAVVIMTNIVRDELFGSVVHNIENLSYSYANLPETKKLLSNGAIHWKNMPSEVKGILSAPIRIYYELTRDCNLKCKQCFNSSGKKVFGEQPFEEVAATLNGIRADGVIDVRFTGGEITRRVDWFEILELSKKLGFVVSVNTNGVYDDISVLEKLASLDIDQITMSIDGNKVTHDFLRGDGNYDKTVKSLEYLKNAGSHLRVNSLLFKHNIDSLDSVSELVGRTCEEVNFFYARPFGRAKNLGDDFLSYEELKIVNEQLDILAEKYNNIRFFHGGQVKKNKSIIHKYLKEELGIRLGSPDGFTCFNINHDGSLWAGGYAEHVNKNLRLGDIKDENFSVRNIWQHSERLEAFRHTAESWQETCNSCAEYSKRCTGFDMELFVTDDMRYCPVSPIVKNDLARFL